jgi:hypothetical protein
MKKLIGNKHPPTRRSSENMNKYLQLNSDEFRSIPGHFSDLVKEKVDKE